MLSHCCCWPVFEQEHLTAERGAKMGRGSKAGLNLLEEILLLHFPWMIDSKDPQCQVLASQPLGGAAGCC